MHMTKMACEIEKTKQKYGINIETYTKAYTCDIEIV